MANSARGPMRGRRSSPMRSGWRPCTVVRGATEQRRDGGGRNARVRNRLPVGPGGCRKTWIVAIYSPSKPKWGMWRFRGQGDPAMQKRLLATTALAGAASLSTTPALAADGIRLTVGGFFKTAYMVVIDDDDEFELGNETNTDGVFSDAEIHFTGSTVLDNGLEVGARVELEGEDDTSPDGDGDQIDEAWIWFSGGFGELRMGSDDEALANSCVLPPGGTANFSAFSPNQWGANSLNEAPFGNVSNSACTGVDDRGDAQKIIYFSPLFHGFQLSASYTPNPDAERHGDGVGTHIGMPPKGFDDDFSEEDADADSDASVYLTYSHQGNDWGFTWGGGASWEIGTDDSPLVSF